MDYPQRPPRYPAYIPIVISRDGIAQTGYIVDVNSNGACISGIQDLTADDAINLRGAIETNAATVRWTGQRRAGVYFDQPIPPQYLAMLRMRSQAYRSDVPLTQMRLV